MKRTFVRLLVLLAVSALVSQGAGPRAAAAPQAATFTDNSTVPIDFIATSCTGEQVIISGESHVLIHATGTPSGHGTFKTHIQFQLSGESASGTRYVVNETVNGTETRDADFLPSTFTSVGHLNVISQGGGDNLSVRTVIHTTVNANGEITSTTFEFTTECHG
jgi:hypothetical protein